MAAFLEGDSGTNLIALVAVIAIFGGPMILAGWGLWLRHRSNERFDEMKREMLALGMSADDIVRVMNAGARPPSSPTAPATPPDHTAAQH
jgi:hypothetical protein